MLAAYKNFFLLFSNRFLAAGIDATHMLVYVLNIHASAFYRFYQLNQFLFFLAQHLYLFLHSLNLFF